HLLPPPEPHSFPTRRSSDLVGGVLTLASGGSPSRRTCSAPGAASTDSGVGDWARFSAGAAWGMSGMRSMTVCAPTSGMAAGGARSEEHTSELQSRVDLVCRL